MKYRKKPVVIEAFQFFSKDFLNALKDELPDWPDWALDAIHTGGYAPPTEVGSIWRDTFRERGKFFCGTLEGRHEITEGDWIIRGIKGEIYPCKPDIVEATYERDDNVVLG